MSIAGKLSERFRSDGALAVDAPRVGSFKEFLEQCARVPTARGEYGPYTFAGREALIEIVDDIDRVLGSASGRPIKDATLSLAGGAQFGKSVLELNLGAYTTGLAWLRWGFYLPDNDLVEGMVDTKFRPDILDQLPWFAEMTKVGRAVNKSGRAVNRKGAFTVTDGKRKSQGMIIGLNKVPTTFTFDITTLDEVDDIKPRLEKFVAARMTSSALRFTVNIGTQRIAGRGMHKKWKDGSQGVMLHRCPACAHELNLEESFPQCVRVALWRAPRHDDPQLTNTAEFKREENGPALATHDPAHHYYRACTKCGAALDLTRKGFRWLHRKPEQRRLENTSYRISQLGIAAIDLSQIVAHWAKAVVDPEQMVTFNCDRRALPESTEQKISAAVLDRARRVESYDMAPRPHEGCKVFAGLDTGRRCWFFSREVERPDIKRVLHLEQIALGNTLARVTQLHALLGISCLFIDQGPETDLARTLALRLNGLEELDVWPAVPDAKDAYVALPGGLVWNGSAGKWENLRCAVVAFTKHKRGAGIVQGFDRFEKAGRNVFVPLIECNRFETIDRAVREFLTPAENVAEVIEIEKGKPFIRIEPAMRLPRKGAGAPRVLEQLDDHLLVGSEREEESGDYVDKCENHFLLADAYSAAAETIGGTSKAAPFAFQAVSDEAGSRDAMFEQRRIL